MENAWYEPQSKMWDISIWWQNQIVIYCLPSSQALFLQGMCAQILTLSGVYLHRIINFIPFHRPCVNFSAVQSVWINNTPLHSTYINARSIYTHPVIKVAKKPQNHERKKKNNGSEWNRKYDVFSRFWWLNIHIGKTPAKPSHHIDPGWQGRFDIPVKSWESMASFASSMRCAADTRHALKNSEWALHISAVNYN